MTATHKPTTGTARKAASRRGSSRDVATELLATAQSLATPARRLERSPELGPRAQRTRQNLIDSASQLFDEKSYASTTVVDIAERAGVSLATFYQYFKDLDAIVSVLVVDFIKASLQRGLDQWDVVQGRAGLRDTIATFAATYVEFRSFLETWACAELINPDMRALSRNYRGVYTKRCVEYLQEGVRLGLVRDDLAVEDIADSMTTFIERSCFEHFVLDQKVSAADQEALVERLTTLWASAIELKELSVRGRQRALAARVGVT
jgi:AcrR family transcriptional regulator